MDYKLESDEELKQLIEDLSHDIVYAKVYYDLFRDLTESMEEYGREFDQTPVFWNLTLQAHKDAFFIRLCRAYDQQDNALHLHNWLKIIQENIHLFEAERFRERTDSTFTRVLRSDARKPEPDQLEQDIELVKPSNPLVKKLVVLRNNVFAHRSASGATQDIDFFEEYPIQYSEVESLIDRAVDILNRYSGLFQATEYYDEIIGGDDYEFILESIRSELERADDRIEEQLSRLED